MKHVFHNRVRVQEDGVNRMHCCYADVITNHTLIKSTTWWPKHYLHEPPFASFLQ